MSLTADQVREKVKAIFEAAFPPNGYATEASVKEFTSMLSPNAVSFDCPLGGANGLTNPTPETLYHWFKENFDPASLKYTEWIMGDIKVSGNTASFKKGFFCDLGKGYVQAETMLMMEIDDDGKLVRWIDHYDVEDMGKQMAAASKKNEE
jgi:hypothetical protein